MGIMVDRVREVLQIETDEDRAAPQDRTRKTFGISDRRLQGCGTTYSAAGYRNLIEHGREGPFGRDLGTEMNYITNHLEYKILVLITAVLMLSFGTIFYLVSSHERNRAVSQDAEKSALLAGSLHRTIDTDMMSFKQTSSAISSETSRHWRVWSGSRLSGAKTISEERQTAKEQEEAFQDLQNH